MIQQCLDNRLLGGLIDRGREIHAVDRRSDVGAEVLDFEGGVSRARFTWGLLFAAAPSGLCRPECATGGFTPVPPGAAEALPPWGRVLVVLWPRQEGRHEVLVVGRTVLVV